VICHYDYHFTVKISDKCTCFCSKVTMDVMRWRHMAYIVISCQSLLCLTQNVGFIFLTLQKTEQEGTEVSTSALSDMGDQILPVVRHVHLFHHLQLTGRLTAKGFDEFGLLRCETLHSFVCNATLHQCNGLFFFLHFQFLLLCEG
jgi:hypothetical protein